MGTRCSGRSPSAPKSTLGAAARGAAVLAVGTATLAAAPDFTASSTSPLVTLPPRPLPLMVDVSSWFSTAVFCAAGIAAGAAAGAFAAAIATGATATFEVTLAEADASVSICAIISLLATELPSGLTIFISTPAAGAGVSSTTLSVSISTRFSSALTNSPAFLCQLTRVASATDSDNCGTLTSIIIESP